MIERLVLKLFQIVLFEKVSPKRKPFIKVRPMKGAVTVAAKEANKTKHIKHGVTSAE